MMTGACLLAKNRGTPVDGHIPQQRNVIDFLLPQAALAL